MLRQQDLQQLACVARGHSQRAAPVLRLQTGRRQALANDQCATTDIPTPDRTSLVCDGLAASPTHTGLCCWQLWCCPEITLRLSCHEVHVLLF
jgi:hypothetical protein